MNYSVYLISDLSSLVHCNTGPFLRTPVWLAVLSEVLFTLIPTLHGNLKDYETVILPGSAWSHMSIQEAYSHIILLM
jgi:hypothetical protein